MQNNNDITYRLSASRGLQGNNIFYQISVPFRVLASLVQMDNDRDVTQRSQRLVNKPRAKALMRYIAKNNADETFWIVPPLIGTLEGNFEFKEVPLDGFSDIGHLVVPIECRIRLFDGQHRAFGIREAMLSHPEIGHQTISIVVYPHLNLQERQQAFHDINSMQKIPSQSIRIAYNNSDPVAEKISSYFRESNVRHLIEYEKDSCSGKSEKVWSLKQWMEFAKLAGEGYLPYLEKFIDELWVTAKLTLLEANQQVRMNQQLRMKEKTVPGIYEAPQALRECYIVPHIVFLKALGKLFAYAQEVGGTPEDTSFGVYPNMWNDFDRDDERWRYRCVSPKGKMLSNKNAVQLTFYRLVKMSRLDTTIEMQADEDKLLAAAKAELDDAA